MSERAPLQERKATRKTAMEVLHALNDHLEEANREIGDLVREFTAALDVLHHAESTSASPERIKTLRSRANELKDRTFELAARMKPLETAADQLASTFDVGKA